MMSLDLSVQGDVHDSLLWQMEIFVPIPHFPPFESDLASHLHRLHVLFSFLVWRACLRECVGAYVGACVPACLRACVFGTGFHSVAQVGLKLELRWPQIVDVYHHAHPCLFYFDLSSIPFTSGSCFSAFPRAPRPLTTHFSFCLQFFLQTRLMTFS